MAKVEKLEDRRVEPRQHPDRQNGADGQHHPKLAPALRKEPSDVKLMVGLRQSKR